LSLGYAFVACNRRGFASAPRTKTNLFKVAKQPADHKSAAKSLFCVLNEGERTAGS